MAYENLLNEFHANEAVQALIPLINQPRFGFIATILAFIFISWALVVACSKRSIVPKFIYFTILSILGSLLFGIATVFVSNSLGVYV